MKTLLFTLEYPPFKGGVAHYYKNIVEHFPKDQSIEVLNNNEGQLLSNFLRPNWIKAYFALRKKVSKNKIDHVLVGHVLPLGTVTYFFSLLSSVKYSVFLHGMDFAMSQKKPRKSLMTKLILKRASNIFCGNSYVADLLRDAIPGIDSKLTIVNPGISNEYQEEPGLAEDLKTKYNLQGKTIMFSISRIVERKGFDMAIKATKKINGDLVYVLIGDGPDRKRLEGLIGDSKNILFINDMVSDKEKNAWFTLCDFFIMPSRDIDGDFEGFGIVYLEANLFSKAVIAGDSGGIRDAVQNNINGLLVKPLSLDEISEAIITLRTQPDLSRELGERGKQRALRDFSWEKQINKIVEKL